VSELLISREAAATTLTLNRPDKANALDAALVEALHAALDVVEKEGVRLLVLRGAGKNFCAGFDFGGFEQMNTAELCWRFVRIEQLLQRLYHADFQTLALVQGGAYGAGADLLAGCAQRVCAPDARMRMPGWKFGLALGTRRLAARIGSEAARRVLGAAQVLQADDALRLGLATEALGAAAWPDRIAAAQAAAHSLSADAQARLNALTVTDSRAADMAALIESLAAGDLPARIRAFRAA
jgi:enoyl-CoA hydratase